jgi:hypothetical protein
MVRVLAHSDILHSLKRQIYQGTGSYLQLQAREARRCGVYPSWSLSFAVLRGVSVRSAPAGSRGPPHFRAIGCWAYHIQSTPAAWLPLHEHRQGYWGWPWRLSQHNSVRPVEFHPCYVPHGYLRFVEPGANFSFELTEKQGAALLTKYRTYREDIELESAFEEYTKRHYDSWVTFARNARHGNDLKPVLVTGVDMTRDFAMIAYSNNSTRLSSEFTTSVPLLASASASAWGTWHTQGLVHTNCGPQLCNPPSSPDTLDLNSVDAFKIDITPNEYNQCVFIRYYTIRKRALMFPKVIKAAAGPHDLGSGDNYDDTTPQLVVQSSSDSDIGSDNSGEPTTDCSSSVTSCGSDIEVFHNASSVCRPPSPLADPYSPT